MTFDCWRLVGRCYPVRGLSVGRTSVACLTDWMKDVLFSRDQTLHTLGTICLICVGRVTKALGASLELLMLWPTKLSIAVSVNALCSDANFRYCDSARRAAPSYRRPMCSRLESADLRRGVSAVNSRLISKTQEPLSSDMLEMIMMSCSGAAYQPEFKFVPAGRLDVWGRKRGWMELRRLGDGV